MAKKVILITVISFAVFFFIDELYFRDLRRELNDLIGQLGLSHIINYILMGIPVFAGILFLHKMKGFSESLGFNRSLLTGLLFSLLCTLPMFMVYPLFYDFDPKISINEILIIGVAAGFFEELYFRGFLFGQLYRYTRFGFILAAFLAALLLVLLHIILGSDVVEIILLFLITFVSGIIFGWVYVEWNYNLWVPIFLHILINLSWEMYAIDEHDMGSSYANIIRLLTVVFFIALTIIYKKRKGKSLVINRSTIFIKKKILV